MRDKDSFTSLKRRSFYVRHSWQPFCLIGDKSSSPVHNGAQTDSTNRMLPAHRKENHSGPLLLDSEAQPGGFGKVLSSIQGLQQRLNDFSVDEASTAEANIQTLIEQLSLLQSKLQRVAEFKHLVSSANLLISKIPQQTFEQVDPDGLENHPRLRAIIKASKLIRLYKGMKAAKADADSVSFDSELGSLNSAIAVENADGSQPMVTLSTPETERTLPLSLPIPSDKKLAVPTAAPTSPDANNKHISEKKWVFSADSKLDDNAEPKFIDAKVRISNQAEQLTVRKPETAFDERLLTDLIQAYGEFSLVPIAATESSRSTAASVAPAESSSTSLPEIVRPKQGADEPQESVAKGSLVPVKTKTSESPNSHSAEKTALQRIEKSEAVKLIVISDASKDPAGSVAEPKPLNRTKDVAAVEKRGELDRQLKNIIKDYGEYDLYSRQSSTNIKRAAIIAFVVLALVLGSLYFFKTPARTTSNPAALAGPSQSGAHLSNQSGISRITDGRRNSGSALADVPESKTVENATK